MPEFDLVVTAGGPAEPPAQPAKLNGGKTLLVEVGEKGENAIVLGFFADPKQPLRYQRVPLDSRFPASPAMKQLMAGYQDQLKQLGFRGTGHPPRHALRNWKATAASSARRSASNAMKSPTRRGRRAPMPRPTPPWPTWTRRETSIPSASVATSSAGIPANSSPTRAATKATQKTPHLENVGCEDCHGPGQRHVAAEQGSDAALQKKMQQAMVITKAEAADPRTSKQNCFSCHDGDNSPAFNFDTYWPLIKHHD